MFDSLKNPFPGIRSFELDDSEFFFGRDVQINDVINYLYKNKFVAVVGPAGSGKSSLIKAGVIPNIVNSDKNIKWEYKIFAPENNPLGNLSKVFFSIIEKIDKSLTEEEFELKINENSDFFYEIINKISKQTGTKFLLYIDQLEDIFFYSDKSEKNSLNSAIFIKNIIDIAKSKDNNIYVLTSLKSDFLGLCRNFEGLVEIINKGHYLVPKLNKEQKIEAITKPFEKNNIKISETFLQKLIDDISENEEQLLLLQHTLKRTWDYWQKNSGITNSIEIEHYIAIGGAENSLNNHAEEIFHNLENEKTKNLTEKILKALVFVKIDNSISRLSVILSDICAITAEKQEVVIKILDNFRNRDVAFIEPYSTQPLNEESLIRIGRDIVLNKWIRLNNLIKEEINSVLIYRQLSLSAALYQKGETKLWINPELQQALNWMKTNNPNLHWAKRYDPYFERAISFLEYSKNEYEFQMQANEKKQKREIRRFRNFAVILGVASLISILFLLFALNLRFEAENSEKQAKVNERLALEKSLFAEQNQKEAVSSKKVAEQQQLIAEEQKLLAEEQKLYALEKQREAIFQKGKAEEAKELAVIAQRRAEKLQEQAEILMNNAIVQKNIAEEQRLRAELSEAKTDSLRLLAVSKSLAANAIKLEQLLEQKDKSIVTTDEEFGLPKIMAIHAFNFNINSGGDKYDPEVFSALSETTGNVNVFEAGKGHSDAVRDVKIFTDGKKVATCSDDGTLKVWEISKSTDNTYSPVNLKTEGNSKSGIRKLDISPNQKNIVCGTTNGKILVWKDYSESVKPLVLSYHTDLITDILFIDDYTVISISNDKTLYKLNIDNQTFEKLATFSSKPVCLTKSKDNSIFTAADFSGKIYVYSILNYSEIKNFKSTNSDISAISLIGNNLIAIGNNSGSFEIFNISTEKSIVSPFFAHISAINNIVYNDKLAYIGTCSYDGTIKLWNTYNFEKDPIVVSDISSWIYSIDFSSDGEYLISGSADKTKLVVYMNVNPETLYQKLLNNYTKNMSEENWYKYVGPGIEYSPDIN